MLKFSTIVKNCPHTRGSKGVVYFSPQMIGELAQAVQDDNEWAIICKAHREEEDWFTVVVDSWYLPQQKRSKAAVDIDEVQELAPEDLVVIHSHNNMSAFFSGTDNTKLNPQFQVSIVIAQKGSTYLGFDYKGEGKIKLPCGATGVVPFEIQPTEGPEVAQVVRGVKDEHLPGDCTKFVNISKDKWHFQKSTECGLEGEEYLLANAFGRESGMLEEIKKIPPEVAKIVGYQGGHQGKSGNKVSHSSPKSNYSKRHRYSSYEERYPKAQGQGKRDNEVDWGNYERTIWCDDCQKRKEVRGYGPTGDLWCISCLADFCWICQCFHNGPCEEGLTEQGVNDSPKQPTLLDVLEAPLEKDEDEQRWWMMMGEGE